MYWWCLGMASGKTILIGPYDSEADAVEAGFRAFDGGNFETYELKTRDRAKATQMVKYKIHEGGKSLDEAMQPISHNTVG